MEFYYDEVDNNVLILKADGGLNAGTADQFVIELEMLIEGGMTRIIVDCGHLDYISSYGLGVLVRIHSKMKKVGGDVKIANIKGLIRDVLKMTHLDKIFEIYEDVNQARLSFRDAE